jgi:hypothetical protein
LDFLCDPCTFGRKVFLESAFSADFLEDKSLAPPTSERFGF